MAKTFSKQALAFGMPGDAYIEYLIQYLPEAASQTAASLVASSPVIWSSGYIAITATDPSTALIGFALNAGSNVAAGAATQRVIPCVQGLKLYANFLASSAADNVLAATDLGTTWRLASNANLLGTGSKGWYFEDTGSSQGIIMTSFYSDQVVPNQSETIAVAGDTNARVTGEVLASVNDWLGAD